MTTQLPAGGPETAPGGFRIIKGKRIKTTLGEHGRQTLIGRTKGTYRFQPLDLPYRVLIGREVDNQLSMRGKQGLRLAHTMAHALTQFGEGDAWAAKTFDAKVVDVGMLYVPDLQYMACVRMAEEYTEGWERATRLEQCPHCKGPLPVKVNVDVTKLYVEAWDEEPMAEYRFKHHWKVGGTTVETMVLGVPRLIRSLMILADEDFSDDLALDMVFLAAAVHEVNGELSTIEWQDFEKRDPKTGRGLHTTDYQNLVDLMNHIMGGIGSGVAWTHSCGNDIAIEFSWADAFFARSGA